jgi:hypothetical protein
VAIVAGAMEKNDVFFGGDTGEVSCGPGAEGVCPPKTEVVESGFAFSVEAGWGKLAKGLVDCVSAFSAESDLPPNIDGAEGDCCWGTPKGFGFACGLKAGLANEVGGAGAASLFEPLVAAGFEKLNCGVDPLWGVATGAAMPMDGLPPA